MKLGMSSAKKRRPKMFDFESGGNYRTHRFHNSHLEKWSSRQEEKEGSHHTIRETEQNS